MPNPTRISLPSASAKQQTENKALWNEGRTPDAAHFFTIGYTGRKIDAFFDLLMAAEVRTLVDIRHNPVSMYRPELNKTSLQRHAESRGLLYEHLPNLGVPREVRRRAADVGSRSVIWEWYDKHVLPSYPGRNLHYFLNSLDHPVALMCVEIDPRECHRHRLFMALEEMGLSGFDL
jgi:uncharacterized protein (DUF488 family)